MNFSILKLAFYVLLCQEHSARCYQHLGPACTFKCFFNYIHLVFGSNFFFSVADQSFQHISLPAVSLGAFSDLEIFL